MMKRTESAFTLLETTLAISVIAIMGLTAAGVSMALSNSYHGSKDYYQCVQVSRVALVRLSNALRSAELVTDASSDSVMIWRDDTNDDGQINASELSVIYLDSESECILQDSIVFPEAWTDSQKAIFDGTFPLASATLSVWASVQNSIYLTSTPMAEGIEAFAVQVSPAAPLTKMVAFQMTVGNEGKSLTSREAVTIRAGQVDRVVWGGTEYTLPSDDDDD